MSEIEIRLSEIMGRHRIKQSQLAEASGVRPAAIHSLYHGDRERVDLKHIAAVLDALHTLTGERYTVGDLLAYTSSET